MGWSHAGDEGSKMCLEVKSICKCIHLLNYKIGRCG